MKKFAIHFFALTGFLMPALALAASGTGELTNPLKFNTIDQFLQGILGAAVLIMTPIIVLFIIYIGFRFVQHSASGNAEELKKDRELLGWALIGALIVLGAQALSFAISATVGALTP